MSTRFATLEDKGIRAQALPGTRQNCFKLSQHCALRLDETWVVSIKQSALDSGTLKAYEAAMMRQINPG